MYQRCIRDVSTLYPAPGARLSYSSSTWVPNGAIVNLNVQLFKLRTSVNCIGGTPSRTRYGYILAPSCLHRGNILDMSRFHRSLHHVSSSAHPGYPFELSCTSSEIASRLDPSIISKTSLNTALIHPVYILDSYRPQQLSRYPGYIPTTTTLKSCS
jgi:hypothetical protein